MDNFLKVLWILIIIYCASGNADARMVSWVDDSGVRHFSNSGSSNGHELTPIKDAELYSYTESEKGDSEVEAIVKQLPPPKKVYKPKVVIKEKPSYVKQATRKKKVTKLSTKRPAKRASRQRTYTSQSYTRTPLKIVKSKTSSTKNKPPATPPASVKRGPAPGVKSYVDQSFKDANKKAQVAANRAKTAAMRDQRRKRLEALPLCESGARGYRGTQSLSRRPNQLREK